MENDVVDPNKKKAHRDRRAGRKADKKKVKDKNAVVQTLTDKQRNPKAFGFNSAVKAERQFRRKQDVDTKKQHIPLVDRTPVEPPPILIAIVGPPKVGKTTLIKNLIKLFTKAPMSNIQGPVSIVIGKKRRITLMECNNDINCMIDLAKVADLVLLLCDANFGFEMEVFEFLNICQVHGMPRIMGVLNHLDMIKNTKKLKTTKKTIKHRFWTEVYPGAKLFYLSGIIRENYLQNEIKNLGRFISVMKFRPLTWRSTHSYLLVDRMEDLTNQELLRNNPKCDRNISLYGYVRGVPLKKGSSVHIAGVGDMKIHDLSFLPDPCPLPEELKKRALIEKEKMVYAPFSGVGGIVYDKDAVYVELGGSHSHKDRSNGDEVDNIVANLIDARETLDTKMKHSEMQIFTGSKKITGKEINEGSDTDEDSENEDQYDENSETEDQYNEKSESEDKNQETEQQNESNESEEEGEEQSDKVQSVKNNDQLKKKKDFDLEDELEEELNRLKKTSYNEEKVFDSGRIRRKVIFDDMTESFAEIDNESFADMDNESFADMDNESSDGDSEEDNEISKKSEMKKDQPKNAKENIHEKIKHVLKNLEEKKKYDESSEEDISEEETLRDQNGFQDPSNEIDEDVEDDSDMDSSEELDKESAVKWKENLAKKAEDAFLERQSTSKNWMKLVYGVFEVKSNKQLQEDIANSKENVDDMDNLLVAVAKNQQKIIMDKESLNAVESTLMEPWSSKTSDWTSSDNKISIKNCFVTGEWKDSEDANELLKLDDAEDLSDIESEIYGDFEDLETGEKHTAQPKGEKRKRDESENDDEYRLKLAEKKKKLKEKFDEEYDTPEKNSYYDELKLTAEKQTQLNKTCFEDLPDELRTQIEGYRPGMYVRLEFQNISAEFVTNFDPTYPVIIGSLNVGEEKIGYVNVKVKKHRWYSKILKTSDPLIISLGWRRFQSIPLFSKLEDDLKYRYLKYTPEHLSCNAHFWGPMTPQKTGFLALQSVESNPEILKNQGFRIAATGVVQELDKSTKIMKKLKLIGYPLKIYQKTAFIKDMFNSSLEVAKFEGAKIKTVSGIRGQIKKPISKPEGCFRATFEDTIKLSDIVFCRTWYKVDVPQFYNPITNLLLPLDEKNTWKGARTTGEIKRENNIRAEVNPDHLYEPIVREEKPFAPLVIPSKLQEALPYRDKPKHGVKNSEKKKRTPRVAVILEPKEQKVTNLMKKIRTMYNQKEEKTRRETKERMDNYRQYIAAQEQGKERNIKKIKKDVMRSRSKKELSKKK